MRNSSLWELLQQAAVNVVVCTIFLGCSESINQTSPNKTPQLEKKVVFDSGRGTGQYDDMTYFKYESEIVFTPDIDIKVSAIRPQINYCNGTSGFIAHIRDIHPPPLVSEAGLVDGRGNMAPTFSDRQLDSVIVLKANTPYLVAMSVWTTKSAGIYATGSRTEGTTGHGRYTVRYARSNLVDLLDRGAIAFELLD